MNHCMVSELRGSPDSSSAGEQALMSGESKGGGGGVDWGGTTSGVRGVGGWAGLVRIPSSGRCVPLLLITNSGRGPPGGPREEHTADHMLGKTTSKIAVLTQYHGSGNTDTWF